MERFLNWLTNTGYAALSRFLPCLVILAAGILVIRIVLSVINKTMAKSKLEKAAHGLIRSVVRVILYGLLALMAAFSLGINITGIVALASVVTLAISLALQNSLTNLIGGFTLLYTKPFASGDYVEIAGQSGTVTEVGMAYTKLMTPDNKLVQIPNANVVASEIINYSSTGTRRVDVTVSASYDMPVEKVLAALKEAAAVEGILDDPAIFAAVTNYGQSTIDYVVRAWCPQEVYWDVYFAMTHNVKKVFDREGVRMSYPHLNVHLDK